MNSHAKLLELVEGAARLLAIGEAEVKQRVLAAYTQKLQYVREAEVPAELVPMLSSIRKRLGHGLADGVQLAVESALDRMTLSAAVKLAADIFEFNAVLSRAAYH